MNSISRDKLYLSILMLLQEHGVTTDHTENLIDMAIDSLLIEDVN